MNNLRKTAAKVVQEVLENNAYSNKVLSNELKNSSFNSLDKGLLTEIVYGTIKYKYTIDVILSYFLRNGIESVDKYILNLLRISIYQIKYLDKVPSFAVVNEAVEGAKEKGVNESKLVNGVLRNFLRNNDDEVYLKNNSELDRLCFKYSFPRWIVQCFLKQYDKEKTKFILEGLNVTPSITVRVNSLNSNFEEVLESLGEFGYNVEEGDVCPEAIRILKGRSIEENPLFKEGKITVQDESAMMVAPIMDIEEGMTIMDLCAAPGGKTTHIAEILNNTGKVLSFDIGKNKLKLIEENAVRLNIKNIVVESMDALEFNENYIEAADRVLIDVPCSGFGIIRKKPEIKWNKNKKDISSLIKIQRDIMINAAKYVNKGGKLIYSTCTLNKEENEENVQWFLSKFTNYKVEKIYSGDLDNLVYSKEGYLTVLPNKNMDGFFMAKLKRLW